MQWLPLMDMSGVCAPIQEKISYFSLFQTIPQRALQSGRNTTEIVLVSVSWEPGARMIKPFWNRYCKLEKSPIIFLPGQEINLPSKQSNLYRDCRKLIKQNNSSKSDDKDNLGYSGRLNGTSMSVKLKCFLLRYLHRSHSVVIFKFSFARLTDDCIQNCCFCSLIRPSTAMHHHPSTILQSNREGKTLIDAFK